MFFSCTLSAKERQISAAAATIVPTRMKGVRRPSLLWRRSEIAPKSGSMNSARMLSIDMMTPDQACRIPNLLVRMSGIVLS